MKSKLENFWYYHKIKVIILIVVIITGIFIMTITGKTVDPDVLVSYVSYFNRIPKETEVSIDEYLANTIKDINKDNKKKLTLVPLDGPRVALEFTSEGSQIVLVDGSTLRQYIATGVFEQVDDLVNKYELDISKNTEVRAKVEDNTEVHTYAIPMKNIPFLLKAKFPADNYYLAIRALKNKNEIAVEKNKNAHEIVEVILGYKE